MIIPDENIDVSGNFNDTSYNVFDSVNNILLKKSFEKPGLSWRSCLFNFNWSRGLRSLDLNFLNLLWSFNRAAFFNDYFSSI